MTASAWPLTGRASHLEQLGRTYRSRQSGGVVVVGPAGVGKTRLAEEAVASAERAGARTSRAVGHPATQGIPLGALAHLLPVELVADLGVGDDERTALFHAARAALQPAAEDDRLVLLIDDVDLLDDTSVAVLVPLIVSRAVFLIGTVRAGRAPSPRLTGLQRDGHLVRLDLEPLGPDDLGVLLHRALDGPVSTAAFTELARLSGGNLQVLIELVRGARQRGALRDVDGVWELTGGLPTTAALDELVAEHLAGVDDHGRAVLELLAVCGSFGLADLDALHGREVLEALEASGLVVVETADRREAVRLAHPLYGEVLRAALPPLRARRINGQLADIVEAHGARRRDDVVRVALWRLRSGGRVAGDHLLRAARLALAGHDAALALQLVEAIADDDVAVGPADRLEVLVEAHALAGADEEVERAMAAVWELDLDDARRARLARRLADTRFSRRGDLDGALAALEMARARVTDSEVLAAVDATRASLLAGAGRPREALAIVAAIGAPTSPLTRVELAGSQAVSLLSLGRCDEAIELSRRAATDHANLPGWLARRGIARHVLNEAHALAYSGRYGPARELLGPAAERARAANASGAWVWFEMALGEIARDTGRGHEAVRRFRDVVAAAPDAGQDAALVWAHVGVAQGHLLLGECEPAAAALRRADELGDSPVATSVGTRERTRGWLDACRGDLSSAVARIRAAAATARRDHVHIFEVSVMHDLVRFGAAAEALPRLEELTALVDGPLVGVHASHARAVVERDASRLDAVVDAYEELDVLGLAAEAAAELAELHRAGSESRLASAAARRSVALADAAGDLRTPALARGSGVEPLTSREREVALLAASGRTSGEIGSHLGVSSRTVDTHLARVYRKLGITSRAELSGALASPTRT